MFDESLTGLLPQLQELETDDHSATLVISIFNAVCLTAEQLIDLERYLEENLPAECPIEVSAK